MIYIYIYTYIYRHIYIIHAIHVYILYIYIYYSGTMKPIQDENELLKICQKHNGLEGLDGLSSDVGLNE